MTIRVNNLPPQDIETDLTQLLSDYGSVQKIEILASENAALVTLNGSLEEDAAVRALNGSEWCDIILELELVPDDTRDPGAPPSGDDGDSHRSPGDPPSGPGNPPPGAGDPPSGPGGPPSGP